jgi:hypothetical protein
MASPPPKSKSWKAQPNEIQTNPENETPPDARPAAAASAVRAGGTRNGGRMSSLKMAERQVLEQHFGMASGYVLNFSDRTFGEFVLEAVGRKIHDAKYTAGGTSKANKLRTFWQLLTLA